MLLSAAVRELASPLTADATENMVSIFDLRRRVGWLDDDCESAALHFRTATSGVLKDN